MERRRTDGGNMQNPEVIRTSGFDGMRTRDKNSLPGQGLFVVGEGSNIETIIDNPGEIRKLIRSRASLHSVEQQSRARDTKNPQFQPQGPDDWSKHVPEQNYDPRQSSYDARQSSYGPPSVQYGEQSGFFPHDEGIYAQQVEHSASETRGIATHEPTGYYGYGVDGKYRNITLFDRQRLIEQRNSYQKEVDASGDGSFKRQKQHHINQIDTYLGSLNPSYN